MSAELERARVRAEELAAGVDTGLIAASDPGDDPETTVRTLKEQAEQLNRQVVALERELSVRQESYLSVADAEEEYETALRVRERVESMADVLTTASDILQRAQEKVHRDIAPRLREGISDRLAKVAGGRYSEVMVNPETLEVEVKDSSGQWRSADQLSHGTAEEVYLLLRVAMAEILTPAGIRCPLLLDDTTVHADAVRTEALLSVIREVSTDHQVVLFSQEESVIRWARSDGVPMVELSQL